MTQHEINMPAWVTLYSDDTALAKGYIFRQGSFDVSDILKRKLVESFPMVMAPNNKNIFRIMPLETYYAFAITQSFEPKNVRREHYRTLIILINKTTESIPKTLNNYFEWLKTEIKNFGPNLDNSPQKKLPSLHENISTDINKSKIMNWILHQIYLADLKISHNFLFDSSEIKTEDWPYEISNLWSSLPKELRLRLNCAWFNEAQEFRLNKVDNEDIHITYVPIPQLNPNWKRILNTYSSQIVKFNEFKDNKHPSEEKINTILYFFNLLESKNRDDIENCIIEIYENINIPPNQFNDFFWLLENIQLIQNRTEKAFKILFQISVKLDTWVKTKYLKPEYYQNLINLIETSLNQKNTFFLEDTQFIFLLPQPITNTNLKEKLSFFWARSIIAGNSFPLGKLHRANIQSIEIIKNSIKIIEKSEPNLNLLDSLLITLNDYSDNIDNRIIWLNLTKSLGIKLFNFILESVLEESIEHFIKIHTWLLKEIPSIALEWHFLIIALSNHLSLNIKQLADILSLFPHSSDEETTILNKALWAHCRKVIGASTFAQVFLQSDRLDLVGFISGDNNLIAAILDEPPSDALIKIYIQQIKYDPKLEYSPRNWENICQWIALQSSLDLTDKKIFFETLEPFNLHFGFSTSNIRSSLLYAPETYMIRTLEFFWTTASLENFNSIESELRDRLISTKPTNSISTNFEYWILNSIELKIFNKKEISQIRNNILPVASKKFNHDFSDLVSKKFPQFIANILRNIEEVLHLSSKNNKRPQLSISDQIIIEKHGNLADKIYLAGNNNSLLKQISSSYQERCDLLTLLLSEIITKRGDIEYWWKRAGQKAKYFPDKDTVNEIWTIINEKIENGTISYSKALQASWDVLQQTRNTYIKDQRKTHYSQLARLDLYHSLID